MHSSKLTIVGESVGSKLGALVGLGVGGVSSIGDNVGLKVGVIVGDKVGD